MMRYGSLQPVTVFLLVNSKLMIELMINLLAEFDKHRSKNWMLSLRSEVSQGISREEEEEGESVGRQEIELLRCSIRNCDEYIPCCIQHHLKTVSLCRDV